MDYRLRLSRNDLECLYDHAETTLPLESVALLFGQVSENCVIVSRIEIVENSKKSHTEFSVDPVVQYKLYLKAEEIGDELVCIFHSHPASAKPSGKDTMNMKLNPVVWLIASKISGQWDSKAFILQDSQVHEITIDLEL
ncbi:MAG: M67 family metallopeptidase [Candidatus Thorarchaeota archaeon]